MSGLRVPGVCAGWVDPRVLLFCVVGTVKRGGNLSFGSLPAFSSFCVERMTGGEPATSTLGVALYQIELHLRVSPLV